MLTAQSPQFFTVATPGGIFLRDAPQQQSNKVAWLREGIDLIRLDTVHLFPGSIQDDGTTVSGEWYWIKTLANQTGYVFSAYVIAKMDEPINNGPCGADLDSCITHLYTEDFNLTIYNFSIEGHQWSYDTLIMYEEVFFEIGDNLLALEIVASGNTPEVWYTYEERMWPYEVVTPAGDSIQPWLDAEPFQRLPVFNGKYFRLPQTPYNDLMEAREKNLGLERVPDWDQGGEGGWVPRFMYRGVRHSYLVESLLLKVKYLAMDGSMTTRYIRISLSYGC
jgi:hypothetical protein